jgi:hypothetical protein
MITQRQYKALAAIFTLAMVLLLLYDLTSDSEMKKINVIFESTAVIMGVFLLVKGKARTDAG